MKCLIECSLSHQFVERDSILGQGAYLIGLITYGYNCKWCLYLGFCFTLIGLGAGLTLGDGGAEGGMGFILGGLGGCGGVGATPGFPGIPFVPPPGVL